MIAASASQAPATRIPVSACDIGFLLSLWPDVRSAITASVPRSVGKLRRGAAHPWPIGLTCKIGRKGGAALRTNHPIGADDDMGDSTHARPAQTRRCS